MRADVLTALHQLMAAPTEHGGSTCEQGGGCTAACGLFRAALWPSSCRPGAISRSGTCVSPAASERGAFGFPEDTCRIADVVCTALQGSNAALATAAMPLVPLLAARGHSVGRVGGWQGFGRAAQRQGSNAVDGTASDSSCSTAAGHVTASLAAEQATRRADIDLPRDPAYQNGLCYQHRPGGEVSSSSSLLVRAAGSAALRPIRGFARYTAAMLCAHPRAGAEEQRGAHVVCVRSRDASAGAQALAQLLHALQCTPALHHTERAAATHAAAHANGTPGACQCSPMASARAHRRLHAALESTASATRQQL